MSTAPTHASSLHQVRPWPHKVMNLVVLGLVSTQVTTTVPVVVDEHASGHGSEPCKQRCVLGWAGHCRCSPVGLLFGQKRPHVSHIPVVTSSEKYGVLNASTFAVDATWVDSSRTASAIDGRLIQAVPCQPGRRLTSSAGVLTQAG
jgi:hypothetical protein